MSLDTLENRLAILLAKYDIKQDDKERSKTGAFESSIDTDMSEIGLVRRENAQLKTMIESQREIIDLFRTKYLDLSLEYNENVERIRRTHQNELKNLHSQFRERLKSADK